MARIMIVDDAAFMRSFIKNILLEEGHQVVGEAADGKEAIKLYTKCRPDLITMDITMPEMDGIEALTEILIIDPNAKIIMCSAMGQTSLVIKAIQSGASDFVVKPLQKERLIEAIRRHS